jgi:hypothetical protein
MFAGRHTGIMDADIVIPQNINMLGVPKELLISLMGESNISAAQHSGLSTPMNLDGATTSTAFARPQKCTEAAAAASRPMQRHQSTSPCSGGRNTQDHHDSDSDGSIPGISMLRAHSMPSPMPSLLIDRDAGGNVHRRLFYDEEVPEGIRKCFDHSGIHVTSFDEMDVSEENDLLAWSLRLPGTSHGSEDGPFQNVWMIND